MLTLTFWSLLRLGRRPSFVGESWFQILLWTFSWFFVVKAFGFRLSKSSFLDNRAFKPSPLPHNKSTLRLNKLFNIFRPFYKFLFGRHFVIYLASRPQITKSNCKKSFFNLFFFYFLLFWLNIERKFTFSSSINRLKPFNFSTIHRNKYLKKGWEREKEQRQWTVSFSLNLMLTRWWKTSWLAITHFTVYAFSQKTISKKTFHMNTSICINFPLIAWEKGETNCVRVWERERARERGRGNMKYVEAIKYIFAQIEERFTLWPYMLRVFRRT